MISKIKNIYLPLGAIISLGCLSAQERPNIVIIFADDLGYNDIECRNNIFATPNIDRLAKESTEFVNAYVPSPTSSPSRFGLLTGRHPLKGGLVRHINNAETKIGSSGEFGVNDSDPGRIPSRFFMPLQEITLAEVLRDAGYRTAIVGKWHLGSNEYFPDKQGFEHIFGVTDLGQPINYYPDYFKRPSNARQGEYLNDYLTNNAVELIKGHDYKSPLLLYFPHYAVHTPHIGKTERTKYYIEQGYEPNYANYLSMVESLDQSVGAICKALSERRVDDNTIVIFCSDQGGFFSNAPLRGGKMNAEALFEGGVRVPMMIRMGDKIPKTRQTVPVSTLDIFPTLLDFAHIDYPNRENLDGHSLHSLLLNGEPLKTRPLYFYRSYDDRYSSIIEDGVKYIATRSGKDEAYDLNTDPYEKNNLLNNDKGSKSLEQLRNKLSQFVMQYETNLKNCQ